jgi:hypothetical protein
VGTLRPFSKKSGKWLVTNFNKTTKPAQRLPPRQQILQETLHSERRLRITPHQATRLPHRQITTRCCRFRHRAHRMEHPDLLPLVGGDQSSNHSVAAYRQTRLRAVRDWAWPWPNRGAEVLGGTLTYRPADGGTGACFRLELPASLKSEGPTDSSPNANTSIVNASRRGLLDATHHSRPERLARPYRVRLLHPLPSTALRPPRPLCVSVFNGR